MGWGGGDLCPGPESSSDMRPQGPVPQHTLTPSTTPPSSGAPPAVMGPRGHSLHYPLGAPVLPHLCPEPCPAALPRPPGVPSAPSGPRAAMTPRHTARPGLGPAPRRLHVPKVPVSAGGRPVLACQPSNPLLLFLVPGHVLPISAVLPFLPRPPGASSYPAQGDRSCPAS